MKSKKPIFSSIIFAAKNSYKPSKPNSSLKSSNLINHFRSQPISFLDKLWYSSSSSSTPSDPDSVSVKSNPECDEPIDAGSSIRKPISLWPGMYHSPVTNALWEARSNLYEPVIPNSPTNINSNNIKQIIAKPPSKSRTSVVYKFSTDYVLREQYRNPWNRMRMGKLVEDLDALAGTISFKHCSSDETLTSPLILVTASVDKIVLKEPILVERDVTIVGSVTWVGRSSMEIQLVVTQVTKERSDDSDSVVLTANFTFVARDSVTGKSAQINQVKPETKDEKLLWEEAEERNKRRKEKKREQGKIDAGEQRNIHGRIFGGFLMRRAFELGFATAYSFAGSAPCFVEVDHVDFLKPVDVGNFLRFKSCVLYTELENPDKPLINVEVVAHVTRPEKRVSEVSNKFYFTFTVNSESLGQQIRNVVPATEEEARRVIERMDAETER
ncbi:hypothetical protein AgCh_038514 [Apium graveolens]